MNFAYDLGSFQGRVRLASLRRRKTRDLVTEKFSTRRSKEIKVCSTPCAILWLTAWVTRSVCPLNTILGSFINRLGGYWYYAAAW